MSDGARDAALVHSALRDWERRIQAEVVRLERNLEGEGGGPPSVQTTVAALDGATARLARLNSVLHSFEDRFDSARELLSRTPPGRGPRAIVCVAAAPSSAPARAFRERAAPRVRSGGSPLDDIFTGAALREAGPAENVTYIGSYGRPFGRLPSHADKRRWGSSSPDVRTAVARSPILAHASFIDTRSLLQAANPPMDDVARRLVF